MNIDLYTKLDCSFCVQAKTLLEKHNLPYNQFKMGDNITRDEIIFMFPNSRTMPIIVIDDKLIGGFQELQKYILDKI